MTDQNQEIEYDWESWDSNIELPGKESLSADKLDRARYAEFLTKYLNNAGQREGGYVMNLNAEWGAGKTWFLKRWCETLRPNHPVAYIDAWKNDFSDDPLLTVIDAVIKALRSNPNVRALDYEDRLFSKLKLIGKASAEAALKHAKLESFGEILGLHREKAGNIEESRKLISRWLGDVVSSPINENYRSPMYIFIDELDRCRPTYAIELLEEVKHLFELQNIVFVIATNTDQLQHSIKAVYGEGFDASRYLGRFFNRNFALEQMALNDFISSQETTEQLWQLLESTYDKTLVFESRESFIQLLSAIADFFRFELRTCLQWLDRSLACCKYSPNVLTDYEWPYLLIMLGVRVGPDGIFEKLFLDIPERVREKEKPSSGLHDSNTGMIILASNMGNNKEHWGEVKEDYKNYLSRLRTFSVDGLAVSREIIGHFLSERTYRPIDQCCVQWTFGSDELLEMADTVAGYKHHQAKLSAGNVVDKKLTVGMSLFLQEKMERVEDIPSRAKYLRLVNMASSLD